MTRRRPRAWYPHGTDPVDLASPPGPNTPGLPTTDADVIEPFITDGGTTFYPSGYDDGEVPVDPAPSAVQLVCEQFVPMGRVGFIKRIEIAPCIPPVLADPWRGWDATFNFFQAGPNPFASPIRAASQAGLWETPMAWEGYGDAAAAAANQMPRWRWMITLLDGDANKFREEQGIPPFNPANPASWNLALNFPVPVVPHYGQSAASDPALPGRMVPGYLGARRFQATPSDPLPVHIMVPENSTILLWAYWRQLAATPLLAFGPNGPLQPWAGSGIDPVYPLLPSVGRLIGYQQAISRDAATENAETGWGA